MGAVYVMADVLTETSNGKTAIVDLFMILLKKYNALLRGKL
jgi:hypothetical protein